MSISLRPHGQQHARLPGPSPTPWACSNSYPASWWCHPTISSSVVPFSSCLHSLPVSGSVLMSQFFTSHSLSYEISQPIKANHTTFHRLTRSLWWSMLSVECVSEQIHFLSITVIRQQEPEFHYCGFWPSHVSQSPKQGFGPVQILAHAFKSQHDEAFSALLDLQNLDQCPGNT